MCNSDNQGVFNTVLTDFIGQGRAFTAFDVYMEGKQVHQITERYRDCKDYIHGCQVLNDEMQFGNYIKSQAAFAGGNGVKPFIYHPTSYDISQYQPLAQTKVTPVVKSAQPVQSTTASTTDDDDDDGKHSLDYRQRLMVPTRFLREIGANASSEVYIYHDNDGKNDRIMITLTKPSCNYRVQRVERNGDIRLSQTCLSECHLLGTKYELSTETHTLGKAVIVTV
jgi:hypothetical protein